MRWNLAARRDRARAAAAALLCACLSSAGAPPPPGFTPLFDGTLGAATIENGGTFTIENGVLRAEGPEGWLRFPGQYRNVRARAELRFTTSNGDSGVFLRAVPDRAFARGWPNRSYQVQLLNPLAGGTLPPVGGVFRHGMPPGETTLDREALSRAFTGTGEWQVLEIELMGTDLTVKLNGVQVTSASGIEGRRSNLARSTRSRSTSTVKRSIVVGVTLDLSIAREGEYANVARKVEAVARPGC